MAGALETSEYLVVEAMRPATARGNGRGQSPQQDPALMNRLKDFKLALSDSFMPFQSLSGSRLLCVKELETQQKNEALHGARGLLSRLGCMGMASC